ncbi:MAG: DUF364 domain-containing protein [Treponema sp.]|nr:DUF364 domain-containing protein [Treponema sp.]
MKPLKEHAAWALYDALVEEIPLHYRVDEVLRRNWTMVRSGDNVGIAMTVRGKTRPAGMVSFRRGMPLRELAAAVKSWNFAEASLGMAAINTYWNSAERETVARALKRGKTEAFNAWRNRVRGKKVAVIGHFSRLEEKLGAICELSILEKRPLPGDYPDSACEFLLPLQDFVFATGVTLTNKTLPRLLELARGTGIILTGPSVPLAPLLFDWGIRDLQGFVVTNPALCRKIINGENSGAAIFDAGRQISIASSS